MLEMKDSTPLDQIRAEIESQEGLIDLRALSEALGLDYNQLVASLWEAPPCPQPQVPEPEDPRMLGRTPYRRWVVAIKKPGRCWPGKFSEALALARMKHDAGTHEMFQAKMSGWVVQYCIPRIRAVAPRSFFGRGGR